MPRRSNIVVEKHWREGVHRQLCEQLWKQISAAERPSDIAPVQPFGHHVLVQLQRNDLVLVGVVGRDVNALMVVELLGRLGDLFDLYLKELTEDALRDNFITVYQLLDEMVDNGVPLHTESNVLQELVMPPVCTTLATHATATQPPRNGHATATLAPRAR